MIQLTLEEKTTITALPPNVFEKIAFLLAEDGKWKELSAFARSHRNIKREVDPLYEKFKNLKKATVKPLHKLRAFGHYIEDDYIYDVVFSPNGKMFAVASAESTIKVWRIDEAGRYKVKYTFELLIDAEEDDFYITTFKIAFSPDSKTLIAASSDRKIRIWNLENNTGNPVPHIIPTDFEIDIDNVFVYSPDREMLAAGLDNGSVILWDISNRRHLITISSIPNPYSQHSFPMIIHSIAFSPDGKTLAVAYSDDHNIRLYRVADGTLLRTLKGHNDVVNGVAFSPDGKTLSSASDDKTVRLWRAADGHPLATLQGHGVWVRSVAFSPDGTTLASASVDKTVRLWRLSDYKSIATFKTSKNNDPLISFSPDGKTLASAGELYIHIWDLEPFQVFLKQSGGKKKRVRKSTKKH